MAEKSLDVVVESVVVEETLDQNCQTYPVVGDVEPDTPVGGASLKNPCLNRVDALLKNPPPLPRRQIHYRRTLVYVFAKNYDNDKLYHTWNKHVACDFCFDEPLFDLGLNGVTYIHSLLQHIQSGRVGDRSRYGTKIECVISGSFHPETSRFKRPTTLPLKYDTRRMTFDNDHTAICFVRCGHFGELRNLS